MHNVRATKASEILATSASELNTRSSQFSIHNGRKKKITTIQHSSTAMGIKQ